MAGNLPRRIIHVVALAVIWVFVSLPALARVHDRLSTRDDVSSFRPSKNLERPHEKIVAVEVTVPPVPVATAPAWHESPVDRCNRALAAACSDPLAPRAPPVR